MSRGSAHNLSAHSIPHELTTFVGRDVELTELKRLLRERRLVTVTGAGGSGKTRLVVEAAPTLVNDFPGGIFLVELAPLSRPDLVADTVTRALGLELVPERSAINELIDFLRAREVLLVLDNCEHLLDECARLAAELLAACPGLRVLATSREPLGVGGECVFRVPLLTLPDPRLAADPVRLADFESVQLFVDRARLANRGFALTAATAWAVAQVCIRLDGIPLALELAAASLRTLPLAELVARLDQRFRLLTAGSSTVLPRHQTLQALLDWSYALLDPRQQMVFRRLSVFPAAWTADAAQVVCMGGADAPDGDDSIRADVVLDVLMQLVDKSLVQLEHATGRYRMLETIRLYALGKLQTAGEQERTGHQHFALYLDLAEQSTAHYGGPAQEEWFQGLEREQANLRAALSSAIDAGRAEEAARLALTLWKFWIAHAHHHEARRWLEQILALDTGAPQSVLPAPLRARLLGALGVLAHTMNEFEQASRYLNESLHIWREQENSAGIAAALLDLGWMHFQAMNLVDARRYAEESLALARAAGDPVAVAKALNLFGIASREGGALDEVVRAVEEGLSIWRAQGVLPEVANALINLGRVEQRRGHLERAGQFMLEAVRLHVALGDYAGLIGGLVLMVFFEFDSGQPPRERTDMVYEPLGYLTSGRLLHEPVTAARLLGVMAAWQEKVVGRNTVQWDMLGVPLCAKLSAEMGEVNFAREFALGQAMGMDDIVALAEELARAAAALPAGYGTDPRSPAPATASQTSSPSQESLSGLTQREIQVLKLVAAGLTNAQIASRLSVTPRTVNAHLTSVYSKTGVTSRTGAVRFALDHDLA